MKRAVPCQKMTGFTEKLRFSEGIAKTYMILGVSVACLESLLLLELRFVSPKFESSKKFCEYFSLSSHLINLPFRLLKQNCFL